MTFRSWLLMLGDVAVLYASLALTLWLRHRAVPFNDYWTHHVVPFSLIFVVWLFVFYVYDLNEERGQIIFPNGEILSEKAFFNLKKHTKINNGNQFNG